MILKPAISLWTLLLLSQAFAWAQSANTPKSPINLLDDPQFTDWTFHLWPERSLTDKREDIWTIHEDGLMNVSGKGWGYLRTNQRYRDYHLVMEYQWGEHTVGYREDRARDNGLLLHAYGEDGAFIQSWMNSIEAQLIEGGSGDVLVLAGKDKDGNKMPTRVTAPVRFDRDGEPFWSPTGERQTFPPPEKQASRINWRDRDSDWRDVKGFRGAKDIENPVGEWNRLEVISRDDSMQVFINGELVNEAFNVYPTEGYLCIQSEGAELWVRRWELWPLDQFKEAWNPEEVATNMGASVVGESLLPRRFAWSPEKTRESWHIGGDYEMQLVAAEPITCDPVDVVWDEQGRMFVAEMRDYPYPPEKGPLLSRIRLLTDEDGDGRMDKAVTWADHLNQVQGLLPMQGGLLATTWNEVLFLKDTDGDDRADEIRSLFTTNIPKYNQLQVSSPRWALDNGIYLNNGLDGTEIYPTGSPESVLAFSGWDLRYDPQSHSLSLSTGRGQYGATFDDWGRRHICSNRNPVMIALMPAHTLERNPFALITRGYEDIHPQAAPLRPIQLSHTTAAAHLGTYTSACGLAIYRGHAMPELKGDVFVPDPTAQLVSRNRILTKGLSFTTERMGETYDYLASSDEWCRPVQIRNGPDGALYIVDMYRRFIDHPIFFPDEFLETNYMRAGFDHGRIWRLVPKGGIAYQADPLPREAGELVELLSHDNAWQRTHAQRLLVENRMTTAIPALTRLMQTGKSAQGRLHAFWTLKGLDALSADQIASRLKDEDLGVVENAINLADPDTHLAELRQLVLGENKRLSFQALLALGSSSTDATDTYKSVLLRGALSEPWMRKAILSATHPHSATLVAAVQQQTDQLMANQGVAKQDVAAFIREFTSECAARGDVDGIRLIVSQVNAEKPRFTDSATVEGLSAGLKRSQLSSQTLAALMDRPPAPLTRQDLAGIAAVLDSATAVVLDRNRDESERLAFMPILQEQGKARVFEVVKQLLGPEESPEIQRAACRMLSRYNRTAAAEFFFENWESLGPTARGEALEMMASNEASGYLLMQKMKQGEINPALMPSFRRWWLVRRKDEKVAALAKELFGGVKEDRAAVMEEFATALRQYPGDPVKGKAAFIKGACATCHAMGDLGIDVGPPIADVRFKPREALLADLIDPNRAVEDRWAIYNVQTKDGRTLAGIIASQTSSAIEIKLPGGYTESIPRSKIASLQTDGISLMPEGLESTLSKSEMADLIAFLKAP